MMIDYFLKKDETNTKKKINECIEYYINNDYLTDKISFNKIYDEYDKIFNLKPRSEYTEKNIFFKKNKIKKIKSEFMKECLLESLKEIIERKTNKDIRNNSSSLNNDINTYKSEFIYYPDLYEKELSSKLLGKDELNRHIIPIDTGDIKDKCNKDYFELAPHQIFLKNILSPNTQYKGLLIFHGVGVGKTCSGISIAENFKDVYGDINKRIIILASQNIRIGWRKTIFDPKKGEDQCTGDEYFYMNDDDENKELNDKDIKKKIKKYYELYGYSSFAKSVKKILIENTKHISDEKEKFKEYQKIIKNTYSDRLLIIDEVHNIRSECKSLDESRDTIYYIELVVKYSNNLRLILLTANPMYNLSTEIVWILNMLLLNDNRKIISLKDIFDSDDNLINEELLKEKCKGYISYLRGENPTSFPLRLYPYHNKENIINCDNSPKYDIFEKKIDDKYKLSFLELYSSILSDKQLEIYTNEYKKYNGLEKLRIENENTLLQISNIVYPTSEDNSDNCIGERGLLNVMNYNSSKNEYSYKSEILSEYGEFFDKEILKNYSSKISNIIDIINNSEGIIFIYSNWINGGVIPLCLALEQNGYNKYDNNNILKTEKKIESISYEGLYKKDYNDKSKFIAAKYMVIEGSKGLSNNFEEELKIVTNDNNFDGHQIKVIIGSTVASEGIDFKNIRSIHVLEPWHNINKIEQVIGRGIRNCSHKLLDPKKRNTTIYLHSSKIPESEIETIDLYFYRNSENKAKQIGKIENILKTSAIDKYFFMNANYLSEKSVGKFKIEPAYIYKKNGTRKTKQFMYEGGDKPYSRVCSFTNVCNYMRNDNPKIYKLNSDTFDIKYSTSLIDVYKKRIHNLFIDSICYNFNELLYNLSEYNEIYIDYLCKALNEMIINKYLLHNYNGDKGYLIYQDNLFIFQPYFNEDKLLPIYYRLNKGEINKNKCIIKSKLKRETELIYEKQSFNESDIRKIYDYIENLELFFDYEKEILTDLDLYNLNYLTFSYIFDRLRYEDKLILLYSVFIYLKEGESIREYEFMDLLVKCVEKLFLYSNSDNYNYYDKYENKNNKNLIGFILYHNKNNKPIFYQYSNRNIEIFNKVDEIDIIKCLKKNKKSKNLNINNVSWGFTIVPSKRKTGRDYIHNGVLLKVIKKEDKLRDNYSFPPGPGVVIIDSGGLGAWNTNSTKEFIISKDNNFTELLEKMKNKEKFINCDNKRKYVFFIEMGLRYINNFIQLDLIFMKYY